MRRLLQRGGKVSRLGRLTAVAVVLTGAIWASSANRPEVALASCSGEDTIFWGEWNSTAWRTNTHGGRAELPLGARSISNCFSTYYEWSTSFFSVNGPGLTYAEVGWEGWKDVGGARLYHAFYEWYIAGNIRGNLRDTFPCSNAPGDVHRYTVANVSGTTQFNLTLTCLDGSGFHYTHTTDPMIESSFGTPRGETSRLPDSSIGMGDDHNALAYLNSNRVWVGWTDPKCQSDNVAGWQGSQISATEYKTIQGTGGC